LINKPRLWTRPFIAVTCVNLFICLSFYLLLVITSVYAMDSFSSSAALAGLAASLFVIGGIVSRLYSGRIVERLGRRKMLYAGLIFNLIAMLAYFVTSNYTLLLIVRFIHGVAFGIATTATNTIVASVIPRERRGEGMAYYISLSATLSSAIGPFFGMFLRQHANYNSIFILCTIFAVISLAGTSLLRVPEIKLTEEQIKETKQFNLKGFFETKAIPISIIAGLLYCCYSSVLTFLTVYAKEINLSEIAAFFFMVLSAATLLSRPFSGRLLDLKGENIVMYPAILLFFSGMVLLSQTHNWYILLAAAVVMGLGLGSVMSTGQTIALKLAPSHHNGLATSTYLVAVDAGVAIGPYIFGLFVPITGYNGVYLITAGLAIIILALYYLLHGRKAIQSIAKP
jgi:MFS family permease